MILPALQCLVLLSRALKDTPCVTQNIYGEDQHGFLLLYMFSVLPDYKTATDNLQLSATDFKMLSLQASMCTEFR